MSQTERQRRAARRKAAKAKGLAYIDMKIRASDGAVINSEGMCVPERVALRLFRQLLQKEQNPLED
jgi:hypothetical protein